MRQGAFGWLGRVRRAWLPVLGLLPIRFRGDRRPPGLGQLGEKIAAGHLRKKGFRVLCAGYRTRWSEIDLICLDRQTIVFVEVKTRSTDTPEAPYEAVGADKQRRLTQAALAFLKKRGWLQRRARFDVVSVRVSPDGQAREIRHFVNAFEPTGFGQFYS